MIRLTNAEKPGHIDDFRKLLVAYGNLRGLDNALGNYEEELKSLPGNYLSIVLAYIEQEVTGCVAYREIGDRICEMKRLFVLPQFQGRGIGKELVKQILQNAKEAQYAYMRLDSHPWMESAQRLYEIYGFYEIDRYNDNPTPGIKFYEVSL